MSEISRAKEFVQGNVDKELLQKLDELEKADKGMWLIDPQIFGVVGFVHTDNINRAYLVVYLDDQDFEVGEDLWSE